MGSDVYEHLRVERRGAVLRLSLNRPEAKNALNRAMRSELRSALLQAEADPDVRVVLLTGEGDSFCAGADIRELGERTMLGSAWAPDRLDTVIEELSKPVVAAVHGYTLGGGFELILACTLRIAADDFKGGFPEIKLGIFPALGATQRLPRMVGESVALSLILTGRIIDAEEAGRLGLFTRVVPPGELLSGAWELAAMLARRPPVAMRAAVEAVRRSLDLSRRDGLDFERRLFGIVCGTADKNEGVAAWLEKREPQFSGR